MKYSLVFTLALCAGVLLPAADTPSDQPAQHDKRLVAIMSPKDRDQFFIFGPYWHNSLNLLYDHQFTSKTFAIPRKIYQELLVGVAAAIAEKKLDSRALDGHNLTADLY